jgi:hypothetical protein
MIKSLRCAFIASLLCVSSVLMADNPQPYASVNTMPLTYYFVQDAYILGSLATANSSSIIIDVESNDGGVARYLAQQNIPSVTQIYSVNLWPNGTPPQYDRFQQFLSNVIQEKTAGIITPIRMTPSEAANALNVVADFIYLASNDENALLQQIQSWFSLLSTKGVICGNNWNENSIKIAVSQAANNLNLVLRINDNVWNLQRN